MKQPTTLLDRLITFIYFLGFEVVVYLGLSYLLFDQIEKNPGQEAEIVKDWNSFIYFVLLYAVVAIGTMLVLSSALPRLYKPLVMRYFWFSWLGLAIMLTLAFN